MAPPSAPLRRLLMPTVVASLAATLLLGAADAIVRFNVEKETSGRGGVFERTDNYFLVWTVEVPPGDLLRLPPMFRYAGPLQPEVRLWVVDEGEARVLADGGSPAHVRARAGPAVPFPAIEVRGPPRPAGTSHGLDLVFQVSLAGLSDAQREQLRIDLYSYSIMWPYGASELYDRPVLISSTALGTSQVLGALEVTTLALAGACVLGLLVPGSRGGPDEAGQGPTERLARLGTRAQAYLRSVRLQLLLCGALFMGAILLGIAALGYMFEQLPSMARPEGGWQARSFFATVIAALVGTAAWAVQLLRIQSEIRRLGSLAPPALD